VSQAPALHPPVVPARAVLDLEDDPENGGIGGGGELALPCVAAGPPVEWVGPNTVGDGLVVILGPARANRLPMSALDLAPDRKSGISGLDLAVFSLWLRAA
jgi:hypothetical protein